MSIVVVGLNHRTTPVEVLERVAVARADVPEALRTLSKQEHVGEVVLLSTCNRTEVYARATKFHPCVAEITDFFAEKAAVDPSVLGEYLYTFHDDAAVTHLFGVASGIDSMILGEGEILGQVRTAWRDAEEERCARQGLAGLFRKAVGVGKRARTETEIARRSVSVSSAAVWLATERLGTLDDRRVLVLGAGRMGEGAAVALADSGVAEVVVANRSPERGVELAARVGGRATGLDELDAELRRADLLLTSTGSGDIVLGRREVEEVMARRPGRPLLVVDIAVPRDVHPDVASVPAVTLLDIDDLKAFVEQAMDGRRGEVQRVRSIMSEELQRYRADVSAREVAPVVAALRARGDDILAGEFERFAGRLADLDDETRATVEALVRSTVNKLLHEPTVRVKEAAGSVEGDDLSDALTTLFGL